MSLKRQANRLLRTNWRRAGGINALARELYHLLVNKSTAMSKISTVNLKNNIVVPSSSNFTPGGRLTTSSGTPVTTTDSGSVGTIYYTPYLHDIILLWDGTRWVPVQFSEASLALTATSGSVYDVFGYLSGESLRLETLVWTNTTTRATAVTLQDGRYCKSGHKQRLYLGSFYASGANVTADQSGNRLLWNMYNRAPRPLRVTESTNSWTYSTNSWRRANASIGNLFDVMCGLPEVRLSVTAMGLTTNDANAAPSTGIGIDSTSINSAHIYAGGGDAAALQVHHAEYNGFPGVGLHTISWLEIGASSGITTWFGDSGTTYLQAGMVGDVWS